MLIYGINPVLEALQAGRVREVRVDGAPRATACARSGRWPTRTACRSESCPAQELDRAARGGVHQGVVGRARPTRRTTRCRNWSRGAAGRRCSSCSTASRIRTTSAPSCAPWMPPARDGVIRQTRHAARLDGAAAKASAGAVAHVQIANVVNIARAIEELKDAGVWTVGLAADARGAVRCDRLHATDGARAGRRGAGLRRLVRESLRPPRVDSRCAATCRQPERVGGGGRGAVRGRAAAPGPFDLRRGDAVVPAGGGGCCVTARR